MIRHDYASCSTCHADPSGGGLLTDFGRAQGETTMRTPFFRKKGEEAGKLADFMFGAFKVPDPLLLGGDFRSLAFRRMPAGGTGVNDYFIMQADLQAQLTIDRFRANASAGYAMRGAEGARITSNDEHNVVSRVHWLGVDLGKEKQVLVRAGRMNLPFGLRSIEHTLWTRTETRTDINAAQQYGVAVSYNKDEWRGELMGIVGNFAVAPDDFRSRGYAGYLEYAPKDNLAIGVSSMITHANLDVSLLTPTWRHAHGVFARYAPTKPIVLSAEVDLLHTSQKSPGTTYFGAVSQLTADFELVQGVHLASTLEAGTRGFDNANTAYSVWASAWWFFMPHADLRLDAIMQTGRPTDRETPAAALRTLLLQAHFYL
jgi:hypothetical protein